MSFTVSQSYLKLMSIALVMLSNYLILCCSILFLPSIFLSIRTFANESALLISWPKYQSSSASVSVIPMNIVLISLRIDLFNLLAVQGTLKSLSQKHSFTASVFQCLAFFMVHLSHSYMTTGKTNSFDHINLCRQMVSLLFNILSRFVIAFLPRSKYLLLSWLQSPSAIILEPKKIKHVTVSTFSPSICHKVMVPDAIGFYYAPEISLRSL